MERNDATQRSFDAFEYLPEAVIVTDRSGSICFANRLACEMTGYQAVDLAGSPRRILGLRDLPLEPFAARDRSTVLTDLWSSCGTRIPVEASCRATEDGHFLVTIIRRACGKEPTATDQVMIGQSPVLDTLAVGVLIVEEHGFVTYANRPALEALGLGSGETTGLDVRTLFQPRGHDVLAGDPGRHFIDEALKSTASPQSYEAVLVRADGTRADVALNTAPADPDGTIISFHDISRQKHSERQVMIQRQVLEMIAAGEDPGIATAQIVEYVAEIVPGSRAALYMIDSESGAPAWVAGTDLPAQLGGAALEELDAGLRTFCADVLGSAEPRIIPDVRSENSPDGFPAVLSGHDIHACWAYPLEFTASGSVGVLCVYRDCPGRPSSDERELISDARSLTRVALDRVQIERDLRDQSFNDNLTGLPNRILLMDRLEQALQRTAHSDSLISLLLLDIDQFQMVNDSLGYPAGDQVLREAANRLRTCVRQDDLVARFTSDEFGILLEHVGSESDAINVVMRIQRAFAVPLKVAGVEIYASLSIGMAVASDPDTDAGALVRYADIALHRAKESGRGQFAVFSPAQDLSRVPKIALQSRLHRALAADALQLHYQPLIALADSTASGYEALVRWHDEHFGDVSPDEFLPLADRSGIMSEITAWVLDRSVAQVEQWSEAYNKRLLVAVNVLPSELHDPLLVEQVDAVIERYRIRPDNLVLEMTEHALVDISGGASQIFERLRNLGVRIALDDFGTGFSSLSYLERLPVDFIKIDRTFIQAARGGASRAPVATAMVDLARNLGMITVAEGIETAEDERVARQLGCDLSQGYFYGRPQPESKIRPPNEPHTGSG